MIRRPPRSTLSSSSAASDVYKRQPLLVLALAMLNMPAFTTTFTLNSFAHVSAVLFCFPCSDELSILKLQNRGSAFNMKILESFRLDFSGASGSQKFKPGCNSCQ